MAFHRPGGQASRQPVKRGRGGCPGFLDGGGLTCAELETATHRIPVDRLLDIEQALVSLGVLRNTGELMRLVGEVVTLAAQGDGPGSTREVEALVRGLLRRPDGPA